MSPLSSAHHTHSDAVAAHRYAEPTVVEVLPAWRRDPQRTRNASGAAVTSLPRKSRPYAVAA